MELYRRGSTGAAVREIHAVLETLGLLASVPADPVFDLATDRALRAFQQRRGLSVDGVVGPETYRALTAARCRLGDRILSLASNPFAGDDVAALQERLSELGYDAGRADGIFGTRTAEALRTFQRERGLVPDATCGPTTLRDLRRLGRLVTGGRPHAMRELAQFRRAGAALVDRTILIDPGHGGSDRGVCAHGLEEAALVEDLAHRLAGRLTASGVRAHLSRGSSDSPTDAERAAFANEVQADLVLSLHLGSAESPHPRGVATYHFGTSPDASSLLGAQLASLVQDELVTRSGLTDCRTHHKTWDLLRLTRMPAVRVELGHLTSPADARVLADPGFRDTAADGLLAALRALCGAEAAADTAPERLSA